jgi:hypothetical protein
MILSNTIIIKINYIQYNDIILIVCLFIYNIQSKINKNRYYGVIAHASMRNLH